MNRAIGVVCVAIGLATTSAHGGSLQGAPFGVLAEGTAVTRYTMTATSGASVSFLDYGSTVTDVTAPLSGLSLRSGNSAAARDSQ